MKVKVRGALALLVVLLVSLSVVPSASATAEDYFRMAGPAYWSNCCGTSGNPNGCPYVTIYSWNYNNAAGNNNFGYGGCEVWIRSDMYKYPGRACMVALHEYGHGYGAVDTDNPFDVMYYGTDPANNTPYVRWPCSW